MNQLKYQSQRKFGTYLFTSVVMLCVGPWTGAVQVPNGDFEQGQDTVAQWSLESGRGAWEESGFESERSLSVTGDGSDDAGWNSDSIPVKPGVCYEFVFTAKRSKDAEGSVFAGADCAHRDYWLSEEWKTYSFVFCVPYDRTEIRLRVGQWRMKGTAYFDRVELREVLLFHTKTELGVLGLGETFYQDEYVARHQLESNLSNSAKFLILALAGFNSNRWLFSNGSEVVYDHYLGNKTMKSAKVTVRLINYTSGLCWVRVSNGNGKWECVGDGPLTKSGTFELAIPESFFPHNHLFVQIKGENDESGACSFQVRDYEFRAKFDRPVSLVNGNTAVLAFDEKPSDLNLYSRSMSELIPGKTSQFILKVENKGRSDLQMRAVIREKDRTDATQSDAFAALSGVSFDSTIDVPISGVGDRSYTIEFTSPDRSKTIVRAELMMKVPIIEDVAYGQTITTTQAGTVWWCDATRKISQTRIVPQEKCKNIRITAAKGEYEPFQLVYYPSESYQNVTVEWEELISDSGKSIPKDCLEVLHVEYVPILHPSDTLGSVGMWPDPLPPYTGPFSVEADRNYPLWITIHVPRETTSGIYRGNIHIHTDEMNASIPIELEVYDFALPEKMQLQSGFGFHAGPLKMYHHLKTDAELREVFDLYMRDFSAHRISPYNPLELDPLRYELRAGDDGVEHFTFDFSDFDRAGKRYFDELGFTGYRVDLEGLGGGTFHARQAGKIGNHEQGTLEHERLFAEFAGTVERHIKEMGWLDRCYVYWFDEPDPKDYDFVKEGMALIDKHAPGLRRYLTEQPEEELADSVDVWCLLLDHYDEETCKKQQADGDEIWWYICTAPKAPYPGLFIDHYAIELRAWLWMTYKYNLQGILVWQSNYWTSPTAYPGPDKQNPWTDPMSWVVGYGVETGTKQPWGNGDGRFLYPPKNWTSGETIISGPVRSIRWELLRQGVEDWEYFNALNTYLKSGNLSESNREEAVRLLQIPEDIIGGLTEFAKDPQIYNERRDAIGRFLSEVVK